MFVLVFLFSALLFFLFLWVLKLVDKPTIKKIQEADSTAIALEYRKQLVRNRKNATAVFFAVLFILYVILDILICISSERDLHGFVISLALISEIASAILILVLLKKSHTLQGIQDRVFTVSGKDFLATTGKYVLYLRGFDSDVYDENEINVWAFSEDWLSQVVSQGLGIPLCAVGMTKEADAPIGGQRVYVEDATWEEDVLELMKKAEKIIIRINDRSSCLWEISQSATLIDKCTYVIDDIEKYNKAKRHLVSEFYLPDVPDSGDRSYYFSSDRQLRHFGGTIPDYCELVGLDRDAVKPEDVRDRGQEKKNFFYRNRTMIILGGIIIMISIIRTLISML